MDVYTDPDRPRTYVYKSINKSLVDKYLLRHWWPLAIRAVPPSMPANAVSMIGNLGVWVAFAILSGLALGPMKDFAPSHPWIFGVVAFCLFFYQTCDALDGIQARRTGGDGPLGEFVDHWFDSFNVFLVPFGLILAFPSLPMLLAVVLLLLLSSTDWILLRAVRNTDTLVFEALSSEESQVAIQLFCLAVWAFGFDFWDRPFLMGQSILFWLFGIGVVGILVTSALSLKDSGGYRELGFELLGLLPLSAWTILAWPSLGWPALITGGLLQGFTGSRYTGELLRERLTGLRYKAAIPDVHVMGFLLLAGILVPGLPSWLPLSTALAALLWTGLRLFLQFRATLSRVKSVLGIGLWGPIKAASGGLRDGRQTP
jgi:phosphatidylglycerophosphate synthase